MIPIPIPVGKRFGTLVVVGEGQPHARPSGKKDRLWAVRCDCGRELDVYPTNLRAGRTTSCGHVRPLHVGCSVEGCDRRHFGLSLCRSHYARFRSGKPLDTPWRKRGRGTCEVDGCGRPHLARGFCQAHYHRWNRGADMSTPIKIRKRPTR